MKRITHLYYEHAERRIVNQDHEVIAVKKAKKIFEAGTLKDYNLAMQQLANQDYDMEKVEAYYRSLD